MTHAPNPSSRRWHRLLPAALLLAMFVSSTDADPNQRRSGHLLIVTAENYVDSTPLNEYVASKTGQGLTVATHSVAPGTSNTAIQTYIQGLWGTAAAPDYILIVGDTDGSTATSTTIPHFIGAASRHACSDLYYGCMDAGDDWHPEIPVGRYSVRTVSTLQDVVDKTIFVEAGDFPDPDYVKRAAFLATSDMTSGAEETHDWVIETYLDPAEFQSTKIYARLGGGTSDITNAVNNGVLFVVYGGHSGSSGWSSPGFNQTNVENLSNAGLYPFVFGWSCNTAHYSYDECFGETWLRVANRGAAAYLSASDYIYWGSWEEWEPSRQVEKYLFKSFFSADIWEVGPAWRAALYEFLNDFGSVPGNEDRTRNFFEMFTLLGDPSLLLPQPVGFNLTVTPSTQSLCSPPTDQAVYTVEVEQNQGFDEPITLTAAGLPPGSTVDFSVNAVPPPFTSVMTISNITGGSPGEYNIQVTGTAGEIIKSRSVQLNLSSTVPATVTLTSPPNGAPEVPRQPTLTWEESSEAIDYELEIATDVGFGNIVYSATTNQTSHTVGIRLESATLHYWHVQAVNGCGDSGFSDSFIFTTIEQADYFTEEFPGGGDSFDLDNFTVWFIPDGSGDYYTSCGEEATELPTDPTGGTPISLAEDRYEQVSLAYSKTVKLYNLSYTSFYVCDNGYLTFNSGDTDYTETLADHFNQPRISALFDDLTSGNGTVSWKQLDDRAVVTFEDVPEYGTGNSNTFQYELFFDGDIHITWLGIDCADAIVGLSQGNGLPDDYIESDLSAVGQCGPGFNLSPDPASQDVCAPADAVYTIEVIPLQGFSDPVTLSTVGEPAGTTVDFSVNPVTPPGSSTMTISNTAAATPGEYWITVTGTVPEGQKSTVVRLSIADDLPGTVALTSPSNGEFNVPLQPTLSWESATQAGAYQLQVATDGGFSNVVYQATLTETSHTLDTPLAGATLHHWRVQATNGCGDGDWSIPFTFTTLDLLTPSAYDMLNGETGTYTYFDDTYDGDGNNTQPLAPLSGGLGDLTDGVIATQNWNSTPTPYVGWQSVDPTITIHFDLWVRVRMLTLYLDDSNGSGGVYPPSDVTIVMGGTTVNLTVTDPPSGAPFSVSFDELGLTGDTMELTLADNSSSRYFMISEFEIYGGPCPGDLDGDGEVGLSDLAILLANYGTPTGATYEQGDLDGDGDVDLSDLATLLALYGTSYR